MTLFLFMFEWSHKSYISNMFLNFWKNEFFLIVLTSKGPPLWKKIQKFPKTIFFSKNPSFSFWICIVHVLSILLRYITLMYLKKLNSELFLHTKFHFLPLSFNSQHGQNYSSLSAVFGHIAIWWRKKDNKILPTSSLHRTLINSIEKRVQVRKK